MVYSNLTARGLVEAADKESFQVPDQGRNPCEIDMYKFRLRFVKGAPSKNYSNYLLNLSEIEDTEPMWEDPLFVDMVEE